ncbi:MAG: hypothetical protein BWZ07_02709 [Alphaproteobacteria bacterium ADurb.BinA280]|nr:MAG: hypothetical protein BWZ07_02709 [Alphaproteobacteria bacterium ADurb.BinA280]
MATGRIPCNEEDLLACYANVYNLVPTWQKDKRQQFLVMAAAITDIYAKPEVYDPWFAKAERQISRDLLKLSTPVRLEDFASLADLSELKAFKTLELLFRTNYKDPTDKFAADALYYNSQYLNELEALPIITLEGANVSGGGGLSRRS